MSRPALWLISLSFFLSVPSASIPQETTDLSAREIVETLGWLEGDWMGKTSDGGTWEAKYSSAKGGLILSVNKKVVRGRLSSFEFERFETRGGEVIMSPYPGGKLSPVHFTLSETYDPTTKRAEFLNPKHDFPQRLVYECPSDDRLVIHVTAERGGRQVGFKLDLKRQARD